jgi:hypothetical protein
MIHYLALGRTVLTNTRSRGARPVRPIRRPVRPIRPRLWPPLPQCVHTAAGRVLRGRPVEPRLAQNGQFWGVVELSCWGRPARSWWRWLRGGPGSATTRCSRCCCGSGGAGPGWLKWPRWAGRFLGRALVGAEARGQSLLCWPAAGPGLVGRWGPADRPCGICGLLSLWPLGRCRAGRVIPSVGGVPGLPALPTEGNTR